MLPFKLRTSNDGARSNPESNPYSKTKTKYSQASALQAHAVARNRMKTLSNGALIQVNKPKSLNI